jgi:hypothetical protein
MLNSDGARLALSRGCRLALDTWSEWCEMVTNLARVVKSNAQRLEPERRGLGENGNDSRVEILRCSFQSSMDGHIARDARGATQEPRHLVEGERGRVLLEVRETSSLQDCGM